MKRHLIYILVVCFSQTIVAQMQVSEMLQVNRVVQAQKHKLFLVDFWATWCGPCVHASKQLTILQKQFPEKFYVLSLTQENPEVVKKFLKKHPTDLAVAIDYNGSAFTANNVYSLPYAVLYNAKGDKLWEGHPAELKPANLKKFIQQQTTEISIDKFVKIKGGSSLSSDLKTYIPNSNFELVKHKSFLDFHMYTTNGYEVIQGELSAVLTQLYGIHKTQITIKDEPNYIKAYFKSNQFSSQEKISKILGKLHLKSEQNFTTTDVIELDVDETRLWDAFQIDWEESTPYLIGEDELVIDNATVAEMAHILSKATDLPVVVNKGGFKKKAKHDWKFHYKYFDLMKMDLNDNFGIKIKKATKRIPMYQLR